MTLVAGSATVVAERKLAHKPEKVWRALTQQWLLAEWLMQNDFSPIEGHRFRFTTDPMPHWDGIVEGVVLIAEPPAKLSYEWNSGDTLKTVVTWTLEPTEMGTILRLEQTGFRAEDTQNHRGAQFGWEKNLSRLETALENASW